MVTVVGNAHVFSTAGERKGGSRPGSLIFRSEQMDSPGLGKISWVVCGPGTFRVPPFSERALRAFIVMGLKEGDFLGPRRAVP